MAKKLGLALGAGSAKGLAHIGLLQVLEHENIPIDFIAGSSMGAVVGSVYACGTDIDLAAKMMPLLDAKDFFDWGKMKNGGMMRGERFDELVKMLTKDKEFSESKIPFASVAVDLYSGKLIVQQEGKIHDAVRGSYAIPGIFRPHPWKGMLLVDGGVIARVPCKAVRDMGADVVIGVDVGFRGRENDYQLPLEKNRDFLNASMRIMQWELAKFQEKEADLVIAPFVWDLDSNSMADAEEIIARGRKAAEEALPKIKELLAE